MRKMLISAVAAFFCAVLFTPMVTSAEGREDESNTPATQVAVANPISSLSPEEFDRQVIGKTITGQADVPGRGRTTFHETYLRNGKIKRENGLNLNQDGNWTWKRGMLCRNYPDSPSAPNRWWCGQTILDGRQVTFYDSIRSTVRFQGTL